MKVRKSVYYNYYYSNAPQIPESGKRTPWDAESTNESGDQSNQKSVDQGESSSSEEVQNVNFLFLQPLESLDANIDVNGLFPPQLLDFIKNDQDLYNVFKTFFPEQNSPANCPNEEQSRAVPVQQSMREYSKRRFPQRSGDKLVPCKKVKSSAACVAERTGDGGGDRAL